MSEQEASTGTKYITTPDVQVYQVIEDSYTKIDDEFVMVDGKPVEQEQ